MAAALFPGGAATGENAPRIRAGRRAVAAEDLAVDDGRTNGLFGAPVGGLEIEFV